MALNEYPDRLALSAAAVAAMHHAGDAERPATCEVRASPLAVLLLGLNKRSRQIEKVTLDW